MLIKNNKYGILIDGSEQSNNAYNLIKNEFLLRNDDIFIFHQYNPRVAIVDNNLQPDLLVKKYKTDLKEMVNIDKIKLNFIKKVDKNKINLIQSAYSEDLDFLVMGNYGINGAKDNFNCIGKTVDKVLQQYKKPIIIIKKKFERSLNESLGFNFIILVDGSELSLKNLNLLKKINLKKYDNVYILSLTNNNKDTISEKINKQIEALNIKITEIIYLEKSTEEEPVESILLKYIETNDKVILDFIVIGINGEFSQTKGKYYFGTTAKYLIYNTSLNVIINM